MSTHTPHTAAVLGATGYVGAELIRLLINHPGVELVHVASRSHVGEPVAAVWPHLRGLVDLTIEAVDARKAAEAADVVFFALPHGHSQEVICGLFEGGEKACGAKLVDLSGDFRLDDAQTYEAHYKKAHIAPELLPRFVYGLTEWMGSRVVEAEAVANPGCFATAIGLALAPLAKVGLLPEQVSVFAATGSTGSGKKATATTHHPSRATNFKLYKVLAHQHVPEIVGALSALGQSTRLSFIPASAPMTHGIFATAHILTDQPEAAANAIANAYEATPFVRVAHGSPELNHVVGSNFADIGLIAGDGELVVACAIDNTIKGAAGQAVQNMNLMLGLPETAGLLLAPSLP